MNNQMISLVLPAFNKVKNIEKSTNEFITLLKKTHLIMK